MKTQLKLICIALLLSVSFTGKTQCDNSLIKEAIDSIGDNQVFIREFKIKLNKSTPRKPEPVAKYSLYLQSGIDYKLTIINAKENKKPAVIQIYRKNEQIINNLNTKTDVTSNQVGFNCNETGIYRLYISFIDNEEGCVGIVLSMKIDKLEEKETKNEEKMEIIYKDIETPILIYTDAQPSYEIKHHLSMGTLYSKDDEYYIIVNDTGIVEIKTTIMDENENIVEEVISKFKVIETPEPKVLFHNLDGGLINKDDILGQNNLEITGIKSLYEKEFKIIQFKIGDELNAFNSYRSYNEYLTHQQQDFLSGLKNGDKFYIFDIKIKGPANEIIDAEPIGFIIYE